MNRIQLGSNLFEDCENVLLISGTPLFSYSVEPDGIKLSFNVYSPPAKTAIQVEDNLKKKGDVEVKIGKNYADITMGKKKLFELYVEVDSVVINLDLRPIGLHIYTDPNALHVGGTQLSQNIIKQSKHGISIG
ncbi:MAG: hypothetical protein HZA08_06435 [Nitrospirae bacterium]|nr:hypothetical protein [Nitrospirota bacterium]